MTPSFPRGQLFPQTQAEKVPPLLVPTPLQPLTDPDLALCQPSAPLLWGCLCLCAPHPPHPQWCFHPYLELRLKFVNNFMTRPQVTLSSLALLYPQQCQDLMLRPHFVNWNSRQRISKDRQSVLENCSGNMCARINYKRPEEIEGHFYFPSFTIRFL